MDWFVIRDDGHLGPYSNEQLHILYKNSKIKDSDFIWSESLSDPKSYQEIFLIEYQTPIKKKKQVKKPTNKTKVQPKVIKRKRSKRAAAILLISFTSISFYFLLKPEKDEIVFNRPSKMSMTHFNKLKKTSNAQIEKRENSLTVSKDRSIIWLATNIDFSGQVYLELESIEKEVLANGPIHFTSHSSIKNKLVEFKTFDFSRGDKIMDGFYNAKISYYNNGSLVEKFSEKFFLSNLSPKQFQQKLTRFNEKKKENVHNFWEELSEKYVTIKMLTLQIKNDLKNSMSSKKKYRNFEKVYQKKYGPFFTNFVISNEDSFKEIQHKIFDDKVEVISNYNNLSKLARKIGVISMDAVEALEKSKEQDFNSIFKKLDAIILSCDERIEQISK